MSSVRGPVAFLQSRYFPPICLGVAFLVRLVYALLVDPKPVSDFDWYFYKGIDISFGRGYHEHGAPTAFWPVGYPTFLGALFALFGRTILVAKIANVFLYTGVIALSYWIAGRLFRSALTARLTLLLLTFYPNHIAYTSLVASEILFTFLMLLGVALLLIENSRVLMAVLAGVAFGLSCMVRPQVLPLPLAFILLLPAVRKRPFREILLSVVALYAALLLVLVPWTLRNYRAFGHFVLVSTNGGGNLLIGNNPWADGAYVDRPEYDGIVGRGDEYERDRRFGAYATRYILEHPVATLKLWPKKLWYLYRGDVEGARWSLEGFEVGGKRVPLGVATAAVAVSEMYYVFLGGLCLVSLVLFLKAGRGAGAFPFAGLAVIAYFTLLGAVFYGGSRYHFPIMPWVAMYAAALPDAARRVRVSRPA
ncbi:MAG TPA: phospholipid carrier-dependent glycosyltransferase [Candidatus Binatia bacterium]|nr:phospholipid carrier-dependent glycosyltransferase [Candidatus Binatia bacterium]